MMTPMSDTVVVLAPAPLLTVTIEDRAGEPDIHVHAGGQGIWQARMLSTLGVRVVLCAALGGETGDVLRHLVPTEDVELRAVAAVAAIAERVEIAPWAGTDRS